MEAVQATPPRSQQCCLKHARAGKFWAWLQRTQLPAKLKFANIFVLAG
jgi:hypothetical protein